MTTGIKPYRITGLENLKTDPRRGLMLPKRTRFTPYEDVDENGNIIYVQKMPENIKQQRYTLLHLGELGLGQDYLKQFSEEQLRLALPERFGGQAPSLEEYSPEFEKTEGERQRAAWSSILRRPPTSTVGSAYEDYARVHGQFGAENPLYPGEQALREQYGTEGKGFPGPKEQFPSVVPEAPGRPTITNVETITSETVGKYPGTIEGDNIAVLSNGQIIPVTEEYVKAWTKEKEQSSIISMTQEEETAWEASMARIRLAELQQPGAIPTPEITVPGLKSALQSKQFEEARLERVRKSFEAVYPAGESIPNILEWLREGNSARFVEYLQAVGPNEDTVGLLVELVPNITEAQARAIFGVPDKMPVDVVAASEPAFAGETTFSLAGTGIEPLEPESWLKTVVTKLRGAKGNKIISPLKAAVAELEEKNAGGTVRDDTLNVLTAFGQWFENPIEIPPLVRRIVYGDKPTAPESISPAEVLENLDPVFFGVPPLVSLKGAGAGAKGLAALAQEAARVETGAMKFGGKSVLKGIETKEGLAGRLAVYYQKPVSEYGKLSKDSLLKLWDETISKDRRGLINAIETAQREAKGVPEAAVEGASDVEKALQKYAELTPKPEGLSGRTIRVGEVPKAAPGMPEAGLQPSMIEDVATKEVFPKGKGKITQIKMDDALKLAEYELWQKKEELASLKETLAQERAADLVGLVKPKGVKGEGGISTIGLNELQDLTGKRSWKSVETAANGRKVVRWEYALDELASERGYADSEALKEAIEKVAETKAKIKSLEADVARGVDIPLTAETKPKLPTAAVEWQAVEAAGVKQATVAGEVPPVKPPEPPKVPRPPQAVIPPEPPAIPKSTEIDRIITQSEAQIKQEQPGALTKFGLRIPGVKQALQAERPGLKMTGENQKVLTAMVAENAAKSDVSVWAMGTRYTLLKDLRQAFGKDALHGGQAENVKFIGTAEQAKNKITGTMKDIADNPELYQLTDAQKGVLDSMNSRNDQLLDWVTEKYGAEIGRFTPKEGGAFLPNVDIGDDVIEYLGNETRAAATGRGKTRVWATARDRMAGKTPFEPELDVEKLIWGLDSFKANTAAGQTYRKAIGGLNKAEVIKETHPALYDKWEALHKQLNSLKGSAGTIESNIKKVIYDFENSPIEGADLATLRDALEVELKAGPRKGLGVADIQDEIIKVREAISDLKPSWEAANIKPYTFIQEGVFRYFPADQAKLITESRVNPHGPLGRALEVIEGWRGGAFSGDVSPFAIQGSIGVLADPWGSLKAAKGAIAKGAAEGDFLRSLKIDALADDIAANPAEWGRYASMMGRQLSGTPGEYAAGWLAKIPLIGKSIGKGTEATYITVTRGSFNNWRREYQNMVKHGVPELEAQLAAAANASKVFPLVNPVLKGQSPAIAALFRAMPTSYSFITQPLSLIEQATKGMAKLVTLQKLTAQESLALKSVATMAASTLAVAATSAAISAKAQGKSDEEIQKAMWDAINPDPYNGNFASVIIGDKRIPLGGPYRAIFRAIYPQEVKGIPFPVPFAGVPNYIYNRVTPAIRTQLDLWRNQDYSKREIMTGDMPERFMRLLAYEFEGALPLTAGEVAERIRQGEKYTEDLTQQIISQFAGVNMVTMDNTYLDRQERKMGLPQEIEAKPFTKNEPHIYNVNDFWGDSNRVLSSRERASGKVAGYDDRPKVKAIIEARDIKKTVNQYPNVKLSTINADPTKGDTFQEYHDQWQERLKITDEKELAEFDKKYPKAHLGNIGQRELVLLRQYHDISPTDTKGREQFLRDNPDIAVDPQEDYLKSHPDENAKLALWGQSSIFSVAAYDKVKALAKELDIPDNALPDLKFDGKQIPDDPELRKAFFEYQETKEKFGSGQPETDLMLAKNDKLREAVGYKTPITTPIPALEIDVKNRKLNDQYEALTSEEQRDKFKAEHTEWADDKTRISAYKKQYAFDNTVADKKLVESVVEYGKLPSGNEKTLYRIDQPDFEAAWAKVEGWKPIDVNVDALRLKVKNKDKEAAYEAAPTGEAKALYLKADPAYARDRLRIEGYGKNLTGKLVETYADYYSMPTRKGYEDDWFLIEHPDFYQAMIRLPDSPWQPRDFRKVPSRAVYQLYQQYQRLPDKKVIRESFRRSYANLDAWMVYALGYNPIFR